MKYRIGFCPYCGCYDALPNLADRLSPRWTVLCHNLECLAEGPSATTPEGAVKRWNMRTLCSHTHSQEGE